MNKQEEDTIFHKILRKEIPSTCVYEDDQVYAFNDIAPQAPIHIILIPKKMNGLNMIESAEESHTQQLGYLLYAAKIVAKKVEMNDGYRLVINNGVQGCQSVPYLHIHILGGKQLTWPPGTK